jgi:hypothetical protein
MIAANAITANEINASAVTTAKLDAGAVTAAKIAAGTITATEIASNAITTTKIDAGAVTAAKISVSSLSAIVAEVGSLVVTDGTSDITFKNGSGNTIGVMDAFSSSAGSDTFTGFTWTAYKPDGSANGSMSFYYDTTRTAAVLGVNRIVGVTAFEFNTKAMSEGAADSGGVGYKVLRVPN